MAFTSASLFNTEKVTLIWIFSKGVGEGAILQSQERILIYHIIFDSCGEGLQETWVLSFFCIMGLCLHCRAAIGIKSNDQVTQIMSGWNFLHARWQVK